MMLSPVAVLTVIVLLPVFVSQSIFLRRNDLVRLAKQIDENGGTERAEEEAEHSGTGRLLEHTCFCVDFLESSIGVLFVLAANEHLGHVVQVVPFACTRQTIDLLPHFFVFDLLSGCESESTELSNSSGPQTGQQAGSRPQHC